jgi:hypothetical protein
VSSPVAGAAVIFCQSKDVSLVNHASQLVSYTLELLLVVMLYYVSAGGQAAAG